MQTIYTPCRYDFVGSFLRPAKLKEARALFKEGKISQEELNAITDDAVRDVVAKQKAAGFVKASRCGRKSQVRFRNT